VSTSFGWNENEKFIFSKFKNIRENFPQSAHMLERSAGNSIKKIKPKFPISNPA
jgi:hypothetical protein